MMAMRAMRLNEKDGVAVRPENSSARARREAETTSRYAASVATIADGRPLAFQRTRCVPLPLVGLV
jgi:hypothetical protein